MPKDQTFPGADTKAQWFQDDYPGSVMNANCGVLHTTEGTSWPDYAGGATAPNLTAKPNFSTQRLNWRQHFPIDRSSRALRNLAGGVQTNTLNVCQVELIGTCSPATARKWKGEGRRFIFWPEAPTWALRDLARLLVWLYREHGIPPTSPVKGRWTPYPESYGPGGQRFSQSAWQRLSGWCGHQHVPENTHGDPGAFDFPALRVHVSTMIGPPPEPTPTPEPVRPPINPPDLVEPYAYEPNSLNGASDMLALIRTPGTAQVYATNFIVRRHVTNPAERDVIREAHRAAYGRSIAELNDVSEEIMAAIPVIDNPRTPH